MLVLLNPVLGQGIAHAHRLQHGGVVNAGRGAPGLVAGGPDDMAFRVGQFPRSAQMVRMHMQGTALQRLWGVLPAAPRPSGAIAVRAAAN